MGMKETIVEALKDLVLPELDELKGELKRHGVRLEAVERRLDDFASRFQGFDQHLIDQSRRIDETNQRMDQLRTELTGRIDNVHADLTGRIDKVHADLTGRIDTVHADLAGRIDTVHADLTGRIDTVHAELIVRTDKINADLTARIDQQAVRIDSLTTQVSALGQQVAGLRSDREVQADILERLRRLEDKVAA